MDLCNGINVAEFSVDLSDEALVSWFQERGYEDERPFQELFHRYKNFVWQLCYKFTQNPQDAEDLAQDVFIKVYKSLPRFEGRATFKTWLYRIALNSCYNNARHRQRRPVSTDSDFDTYSEWLPASTSTEQEVEKRAVQTQLTIALNTLRPEESHILRMKDLEERSYTEISKTLSISLSAAKMRAKRARAALKVTFQQASGQLAT